MDLEQTVTTLLSENQHLRKENDQWRLMQSVVQENRDLTAKLQRLGRGSVEECAVCSPSGRNQSSFCQNTLDEGQFRKGLQQARQEQRLSSPTNFTSFIQTSMNTDSSEGVEFQSHTADDPPEAPGPERLLGEIAYQLDKRIMCNVFKGQKRLYGFTLLNIPQKIIEVSTQPLTGKVDEDYRLHLTQRHADLMEMLHQLGYKAALHPAFAEFIVNTYGILKEKPGRNGTEAANYNNPEFLRKAITTTAPGKLQKDLLILLRCLCALAERDGKPLLLL